MRYEFGEFTLRPAEWGDLALAKAWTENDPYHRNRVVPIFWLTYGAETNSFLLLSKHGPVFFFRIDERPAAQAEIHIQFSGPQALREQLTRQGIVEGFTWLEKMLIESGFRGYYFHSINAQLIFFCQKRLGFEWDGTKLYRDFRRKADGEAERKEAQCAAQQ